MLNSMIEHPRPTRAEASDVANGIWDGADAVMLSGETASGKYPLAAVQMMDRIVREAEAGLPRREVRIGEMSAAARVPTGEVVAAAACDAAAAAGAVAICCFTLRGETARQLARYRPPMPIVAFSPDQAIRRRLALYWGVLPKIMEPVKNAELMVELVSARLTEEGLGALGDRVVLVHGSPLGVPGQTNSIRLHEIAHAHERVPGQRYRVPI
jgi:pyruvate kinase